MTLPKGYPDNMRILVIRRGENVRVNLPVDPVAMMLRGVTPPEMALEAAKAILVLQNQDPDRADMPIVPGSTPFGLTHRGSDYVLDPKVALWPQLEGHWEEMTIQLMAISENDSRVVEATVPCCVLNLDDITGAPTA